MRTPDSAERMKRALELQSRLHEANFQETPMKPQPDMAQMPFEYEPMTWRDHARMAIELIAAIAGGFGIFAVIMAARMMAGG